MNIKSTSSVQFIIFDFCQTFLTFDIQFDALELLIFILVCSMSQL